MRTTATKNQSIGWLLSGVVCSAVMCQPARANEGLGFLDTYRLPEGSSVEFGSPDGVTCRHTDSDRPSISVGGGLTRSQVLAGGTYGPTINGPSEPVVGIVFRIPFGVKPHNCDKIIQIEEASIRIRKAQELFELGLISEDELKVVGRKAYAALMD